MELNYFAHTRVRVCNTVGHSTMKDAGNGANELTVDGGWRC